MIFVSLIIPFNKSKRYLKDCLDSIVEQNLDDSEVILIINGNKEDISDLIETYDNQLNLLIKEYDEELGVAKARNEGLDIANGKYIYFIDSDDYLYQDALSKLIESAKNSGADFVNGERINTAYIKDRFEEQSSIKKNKQLLQKDLSDLNYSLRLLVGTKTTRLEILSVLHALIKKETINDLRFDEGNRYFSDYGFILNVINNSDSFAGVENAVYAKRTRDDDINLTSLNQEPKDNRFLMYCEAYQNAWNYCTENNNLKFNILKSEFVKKYQRYYLKEFPNKFLNSPNNDWRNVNFNAMSEISKDFNLNNFSKSQKHEIKSLQRNNKFIYKNMIKFKSSIGTFKSIKKSKGKRKEFIYKNIHNKRSLNENKIIFESFYGKFYSDSPKYIYEYLYENYGDKFEYVWVKRKGFDIKVPGNAKIVEKFSPEYYKEFAQSKYFIFNTRHSAILEKRSDQIFICTWHGTPLKKLGYDQGNLYLDDPKSKQAYKKDSSQWDYMISPNKYTTDILRSAFAYDGEIIESGYPRNDILYNASEDKINQIKNNLKLPEDKKIILYAPTWRDDDHHDNGKLKFTLKLDLNRLKENFGDEYIILLRMHYFIYGNLDLTGCEDFAFDVSKYEDIAELYLISDILITDYSSVFFDYANLKRPILFYAYDMDNYSDIIRGFYFDMYGNVPGPILKTNDEVIDAIINIDQIKEDYAEKYDEFMDKFCYIEDGNASKRIIERVFDT